MNGKNILRNKIFPEKSISGVTFFRQFGHWSLYEKCFPRCTFLGPNGSNDTSFMSLSRPGAESIAVQRDKPTFERITILGNFIFYGVFQKSLHIIVNFASLAVRILSKPVIGIVFGFVLSETRKQVL